MFSDQNYLFLDSVTFGIPSRLRLESFSLAVARKSFTVLYGATGSGKTIVMKLMAGILFPGDGHCYFDGQNWSQLDEEETQQLTKRLGFVFQDAALLSNLSIRENLILPLNLHFPEIAPEEKIQQIHEILTRFGIIHSIDKRPSELSLAQRRLAAWARALIISPEVVLIDEPFLGMDPVTRKKLVMELAELKSNGKTVVCAVQSLIGLDELADKVAVFDRGQIIDFGTVADVMESSNPLTSRLVADDRHTFMISRT